MILLTVIAVGLLTISSISLRASSATAASAEARQNARLALTIALGELQKYAGPDQRVTATANIAGDNLGKELGAGANPANSKSVNSLDKGLSSLQPGTRHWTGVWKNRSAAPATEIQTKTPSPTLLAWLVSGNEPLADPSFTPASAVCSVGSSGKVADAKSAVVVAGRESVGDPDAATLDQYVAVPLVTLSKDKAATGRYGWWIGDEGVKSRVNIDTTVTDSGDYASLNTQRRGWETVSGFASYPAPSPAAQGELSRIVTMPETALAVTGVTGSSGGASPLQSVFHAATTDSRGVIVDTLNGGTRIDLSAVFSSDLPTRSPIAGTDNYPLARANIIPRAGARSITAPKWDTMKEFFDAYQNLANGELIVKSVTSTTGVSISPLITDLRVLLGVHFTRSGSGTAVKANACGKIAVAIANPYSVPLRWKDHLEIELRDQTPYGNRPARIYNLGNNSPFFDREMASLFNNLYFRIPRATLAPGECRAYTLAGYTLRPINSTARTVVDLSPFGSSLPFDFTRCVELDASGTYTSLPALDVRESWQTTLMMAEMRLAGGSSRDQPLLRLERFELDNGYFGPNTRNYSLDDATRRSKPVPLMCYSFQISQPGNDYLNLMPAGYAYGQRSSTLRTFADFNLRAARISKPIASYNPPPYFMESNNGFAQLPDAAPGGDTGMAFTKNLDTVMPWGRGWTGSRNTILFSIPRQITSLAQFQHADLTGDDANASVGHQPGNAFANSYATPFVKRSLVNQLRTDYELLGSSNHSGTNQTRRNYYDISYLLNTAVWDKYFLSTIPATGSAKPAIPSLIALDSGSDTAGLRDPVECASHLTIDGAFNVNSTEKNAWKAFLASSKRLKHKADATPSTDAAFPRSLEQTSPAAVPPSGSADDSFSGFRRLTDDQLDALAGEIVRQVRLRGPFLSLSHFVNRALADIRRQPVLTRSGALQCAIDESGININLNGDKNAFKRVDPTIDRLNLADKNGMPRADMDGTDTGDRPADADPSEPDWAQTSTDNNFGSVASIIADRAMLNTSKKEQGYRSTGIPGWLTQADVLQVIGPSISARSDTFRIRTYGESLDPSGNVRARAWCEAVVQRVPDYIEPANAASERGSELSALNQTYGRQFHIVSFRWLSSNEI